MYAPSGDAEVEKIMQNFVNLNDQRRSGGIGALQMDNGAWTPSMFSVFLRS
jgi:hypothetical protein